MNRQTANGSTDWLLIFSCWLIATISTLGSLFFSEIMELTPCVLCWYQRIFLFPLPIILLIGLYPVDKQVVRYALPVAIIGLLFTVYHCLLFFGVIPESETCAGWNLAGIDAVLQKVNVEWDKHGCLFSHLPDELRQRHQRIHGKAFEQAKASGWSGEFETDDEN